MNGTSCPSIVDNHGYGLPLIWLLLLFVINFNNNIVDN
jgi:hypothetical protein